MKGLQLCTALPVICAYNTFQPPIRRGRDCNFSGSYISISEIRHFQPPIRRERDCNPVEDKEDSEIAETFSPLFVGKGIATGTPQHQR